MCLKFSLEEGLIALTHAPPRKYMTSTLAFTRSPPSLVEDWSFTVNAQADSGR